MATAVLHLDDCRFLLKLVVRREGVNQQSDAFRRREQNLRTFGRRPRRRDATQREVGDCVAVDRRCEIGEAKRLEIADVRLHRLVVALPQLHHRPRRFEDVELGRFLDDGINHGLLTQDALSIIRVGPHTRVAERLAAVHLVGARLEDAGIEVTQELRLRVEGVVDAETLRYLHLDAAEKRDDLLEPVEVDDHVVVDVDVEQVLHRRHDSLDSLALLDRLAELIGAVDPLLKHAVRAVYVDPEVAWDGQRTRRPSLRVDREDEHGVGAAGRGALVWPPIDAHDQEGPAPAAVLDRLGVLDAGCANADIKAAAREEDWVRLRRHDKCGIEGAAGQSQDAE